jgi:hypothetical protein
MSIEAGKNTDSISKEEKGERQGKSRKKLKKKRGEKERSRFKAQRINQWQQGVFDSLAIGLSLLENPQFHMLIPSCGF